MLKSLEKKLLKASKEFEIKENNNQILIPISDSSFILVYEGMYDSVKCEDFELTVAISNLFSNDLIDYYGVITDLGKQALKDNPNEIGAFIVDKIAKVYAPLIISFISLGISIWAITRK